MLNTLHENVYTAYIICLIAAYITCYCHMVHIWMWFDLSSNCICAGIHHPFMPHSCVCELQHLSSNWQDIACHISSSRPPQDMPCSGLWLHITSWPFHLQEHNWNSGCHFWDGIVFIFLLTGEQKEASRWPLSGLPN